MGAAASCGRAVSGGAGRRLTARVAPLWLRGSFVAPLRSKATPGARQIDAPALAVRVGVATGLVAAMLMRVITVCRHGACPISMFIRYKATRGTHSRPPRLRVFLPLRFCRPRWDISAHRFAVHTDVPVKRCIKFAVFAFPLILYE